MPYSSIPAADITAGKPIDTDLMGNIKENEDSLFGLLVGVTGSVYNGSFEVDSDADNIPDLWTFTAYPGGIGLLTTTTDAHGSKAFGMTHPGGASNGGGYLESDYIECSQYVSETISAILWDTAAARNLIELRFFTDAKVFISTTTAYDSTATPATPTYVDYLYTPPATARFMKIRLIGGFTSVDSVGTTYFGYVGKRRTILTNDLGPLSVTEAKIAASAVTREELKTTTSSQSLLVLDTTAGSISPTGGDYAFFVYQSTSRGISTTQGALYTGGSAAYSQNVSYFADASGDVTFYTYHRYMQSSPPYKIGDTVWGHFVYILRNKITGEIHGTYEAQDPPWAYHPLAEGHKDSQERIISKPHPFDNLTDKAGKVVVDFETDPNFEIVLVDMRDFDVERWKKDAMKTAKLSIMEDIQTVIPIGRKVKHIDYNLPEILGFTDKVNFRKRI